MDSESTEQRRVIKWANTQLDDWPILKWLHAIPNGGKRRPREAKKLVAEGVKRGIFDLFLPTARGGYFGLYIEMKKGDGQVSKYQKLFKRDMEREGYFCTVCYNSEEAIKCIKSYLSQPYT